MRKYEVLDRFIPIALGAVALGLSSCNPVSNAISEVNSSEDQLQVVTTFLPITQFTKAVARDRADVEQLVPLNSGLHDYQATPDAVQQLAQSDVLVKNGLEMEAFLEDLITNANNPNLQTIDSSAGISLISNETIEGHNHDHDHSHDHEEEAHTEPGHHHHGEYNPHIWLDPKRAIQQVENIRDGLIAADPAGEAEYTQNAAAYIQQLQQLDAEITAKLQPYQGNTFVAFHDFAPYFAQSYGLNAEFLVDIPEENPAPADVKRVTEVVEKGNLNAILTEPQAGENTFSALAQDLKVSISTFDPIETGTAEALKPEYYFSVMNQNVENLLQAFGGSTQSVLPLWGSQPLTVVPQSVSLRF